MRAVHISTKGMHCPLCAPRIEEAVGRLPGVAAARSYRSMALTSALYDPAVVSALAIEDAIAREGFDARVLAGGECNDVGDSAAPR